MSDAQVKRVIEETLIWGKVDPDDLAARVYNMNGRYGIGEVRVILATDGRGIVTAYPMNGPAVVVVRP